MDGSHRPDRQETSTALTPDVVVMDVAMPRMNGIQATERICASDKDVKVLLVSVLESRDFVEKGLGKGARGYLLKSALFTNLIPAIHTVHKGEIYLSPEIFRRGKTWSQLVVHRARRAISHE